MHRHNLYLVSDAIPAMQLERRNRLAEIDRNTRTDEQHSRDMLGGIMLLCGLAIACLILAWQS